MLAKEQLKDSLLQEVRNANVELAHVTTVEHGGVVVGNKDEPKIGHDDDEEIKEFFDSEEEGRRKAKEIAELIRSATHVVVYTGAGISTAAKIPDYRGPKGVWTLKDRGIATVGGLQIAQAVPTFAHMALSLLYKKGMIKYVVSTNVDGLHRRSGLPVEGLAELHGNCFKEFCNKCGHEYLRDFDCTSKGCRKDHLTGRKCDHCPGDLVDSIIHFGEGLPNSELNPATEHAEKADFALVLGTSMKVSPACKLPSMCFKNKGKLVICNLQKTPFYKAATINMHVPTDIVMLMLVEELGLLNEIPDQTPEGFPIVRPEPYKPQALRENANQQMEQLTNSKPSGHASKGVATVTKKLSNFNLALKVKPTSDVMGKKGEKQEISITNRNEVLFIRSCTGCEYTLTSPIMKLTVDRVEATTVRVNAPILIGTCEIISCQGSTIAFNTQVPTVTVDSCNDCTIAFTGKEGIAQFIWSNCTALKFKVGPKLYEIPEATALRPEVDPSIAQFRTKWTNGSVITELLIREGCGYATTEREKAINDAKDKRNEAMFAKALDSSFAFRKR